MKDKKQILLDELSKESELVIATAYLYAKTFVRYGGDITEAWTTATQQKKLLEKAYNDGYSDALKKREERKVGKWIDYWGDKTEPDGETWWSGCKCSVCGIFIKNHYNYCPNCGAEMRGNEE